MKTVYQKQYFNVIETSLKEQKTKIYTLVNNRFTEIGKIKWELSNNGYVFFPTVNTTWSANVLVDVVNVLDDINKIYKNGGKDSGK